MGKKDRNREKNKDKPKSSSELCPVKTEEERRAASREILNQLNDLNIPASFGAVKQLLVLLKKYNEEGCRVEINIPFPEMNRRLRGVLGIGKREEPFVVLKHENF